ncbi:alpha/beta hydrolase [Phycicoccus sonneratiae]|uniref:Alpha/beta hydrolase n=1 Tax=Phycicoccus sonneratiae TaxID=2807628 RepID=A0ABS2CTC8_9MICO|nr:alpha/beta hydrolase [Phycicoccus sonneraticus]MBM6402369.1 alpha/beta hydrolase [Phycicoccus sonneraticus]
MTLLDDAQAWLMQKSAPFTVRYGEPLRFAGQDLPAPERLRVPTRHGDVRVDLHRPQDTNSDGTPPVVVHFHGGAFVMRYPEMDDWWCRYLAATAGVAVANVDWSVAPQARYPVGQEEGDDVAAELATHGAEYGVDGRRLVVSGFSAGGQVAAAVCLMARDHGSYAPVLQVLGVPALDLASPVEDRPGMVGPDLRRLVRRVYFPDVARRREPYASPLLADDLSGLPPTVVMTGGRDALRPDGDRYAARLRAAGVEVLHHVTPDVDHYFLTDDPVRARVTMAMVAERVRIACGLVAPGR